MERPQGTVPPARRPRFAMAHDEPRAMLWVSRAAIVVASLYLMVFCWSIFRRIRQVLRIELTASSTVIASGATVSYDVVTSGEVQNRILLELVQGSRTATLLERRTRVSAVSALDLRLFRYTPTVVITPQVLTRFTTGPAMLRLTGFGSQKLLRTPAARVRELNVTIAPPR